MTCSLLLKDSQKGNPPQHLPNRKCPIRQVRGGMERIGSSVALNGDAGR